MMNVELVARALAFVGEAAMSLAWVLISAAVFVALAGVVGDVIVATPSTLLRCVGTAVSSVDEAKKASLRRCQAVATFWFVCGLVVAAAAELVDAAVVAVPATLNPADVRNSFVVASLVASAVYAFVELVGLVALVAVKAAGAVATEMVEAVPSALTTFGERIVAAFTFDGVLVASKKSPSRPQASQKVVVVMVEEEPIVAAAVDEEPIITEVDDEEPIQEIKDDEEPAPEALPPKKDKRRVTFGKVQVREYNVKLGDHRCCKRYPMTLGWSHTDGTEYELDAFGSAAKDSGKTYQPLEPRDRRARIAQVAGVSPSVVQEKEHRRRQKLTVAAKASAVVPREAPLETPREKVKKAVSFGKVEIREYGLTLGDHPCCKSYPLTMDWAHTKAKTFDLDRLQRAKSAVPRPDLTPEERLARIANVAGVCPSVVQHKERHRLWMLVTESRPSQRGDGRRR